MRRRTLAWTLVHVVLQFDPSCASRQEVAPAGLNGQLDEGAPAGSSEEDGQVEDDPQLLNVQLMQVSTNLFRGGARVSGRSNRTGPDSSAGAAASGAREAVVLDPGWGALVEGDGLPAEAPQAGPPDTDAVALLDEDARSELQAAQAAAVRELTHEFQASRGAEAQRERADVARREALQGYLSARGRGGSGADELLAENARLRLQALRLRDETESLRQQDSELRREDSLLRAQDAEFRQAAAGSGAVLAGGVHIVGQRAQSKEAIGIAIAVTIFALVGAFLLYCCDCLEFDNLDDSSSDDEDVPAFRMDQRKSAREDRLRALVARPHKRGRICCSCCSCCFNPQFLMFFCSVLVTTALGGAVMWQMGLLQPIIAQFTVYTYIAVVLVCFVGLLISEMWRAMRTLITYIIEEFRKIKAVFQGGLGKAEYFIKDFLDDGRLNRSAPVGLKAKLAKSSSSKG